MTIPFSSHEIAQARSRAYNLLSQLWLDGLTPALYDHVSHIPELAAALPAQFDADRAAAAHQHLFGFSLFPFESLFLTRDGLVGGEASGRVQEAYFGFGFAPPADHAPDHLGLALAALAFLTGAEADAWRDGLDATAARMAGLQQTFLQQHLARWIAPVTIAVRRSGEPFYAQVAALTDQVVSDHLATNMALPTLPPADGLSLDDPGTGLREIARWLLTPLDCGLVLTRDDLRALARAVDLPTGFGDRQQMLVNLLRAAGGYDLLPALVAQLRAVTAAWQAAYAERADAKPEMVRPWAARATVTAGLLGDLHALAAQELQDLVTRGEEAT